ncbi:MULTISPECIES: mannose-1-phosphate guanylyltransferase [Sorangium]|uniref:Mannose-1-phosphate guanylyltransferase n=1 Tax=Sorangium cellulosum TaxID=56 RepID=A0A4P2R5G3_SORCE|nr:MULTISPECIES: mannose-1-phosphate guanylyltransferase [Sorangium]AUX38360.1 mannose-1-phosphate guanylyltransferase [Sorangium cellulosum]WCQ97648.1 Alginate biosynthesis protein AlgA [Sorangium sp. Soce836]
MSSTETPVHVLILAGGAGTRFWPASRAARPKQLLPLLGGEPLITATARRVLPLCGGAGWERIWIATGQHLLAPTRAALPDVSERRLLVEPAPRNTAPCIGWAAATIAREDPEAVVVVLPSDHHIADVPRFLEALEAAVASARGGAITTIGIRPTHAETGFGYIEAEGAAGAGSAAPAAPCKVLRFVEKPSRERAAEFVASGRFLWNAGMFIFRAGDMRAAIRAHLPALAEGLDEIDRAAAQGAAAEAEAVLRVFPRLPAVSVDHGVMEHVAGLAVVPGDFGWSDLGSWQSAWELAEKDERGNSAPAGSVLVDAQGNHLVDLRARAGGAPGDGRVIALVGVEGLVVVETDDALLIVPRDRAQDVKHVVDALKARGQGRHT